MGLISRANKAGSGTGNYAPNTTAKSSEVNVDVNTLYTEFNGNIDNANIKTGAAIESDKIDLSTISQNLYVNGEVRINGTLTAASLNLTNAALSLSSLQLTTSTLITGIFDEDAMTSNSASAVPTQQSVKAYVDGKFPVSIANGGTGQTTAQNAINALTAVSAATNEYVLTKDTSTGNAIFKLPSITYKIGTFAEDTLNASGDISITSVGFQPSMILFFISAGSLSGNTNPWSQIGIAGGTSDYSSGTRFETGTPANVTGHSSNAAIWDVVVKSATGAHYTQSAVLKTFDVDGFTYTRTRAGSISSGAFTVIYVAIK